MPAYEYYCRPCDRTFTVVMSLTEHEAKQVECPHCHGVQVEQLLSTPIFAEPNRLTFPPMHCSISQGLWLVCLPFCVGISRSRSRNTPRLFRGPPRPCRVV